MPGTFGAGSLLSPWVGVWELVWQSPETWLVTGSALIGLTVAGAALTALGSGGTGRPEAQARDVVPAVVVVRTEKRPKRNRRRRRHGHAA